MVLLQCIPGKANAQNPPAIKNDTPKYEKGDPPQITGEMIFINSFRGRSNLIDDMKQIDSEFVFKRAPDRNGLQVYSATDPYSTSFEIVGNEKDVKTLKWTVVLTRDKDLNAKELIRLTRFVQVMEGADAMLWLSNEVRTKVGMNPLLELTETKEFFKGREMTFDYNPKLPGISVTIALKK